MNAEDVYRKARAIYAESIQIKLAANSDDPIAWWRIVNFITGKSGLCGIPTVHHHGTSYETAVDKAEVLKDILPASQPSMIRIKFHLCALT